MDQLRNKVVLFMPAYFAEQTLGSVYRKIPTGYVDEIVVVDDHSHDQIEQVATELGLRFYRNDRNLGYGGNLKVCIQRSLELGADLLIELHPDDQYDPSAIPQALEKIDDGYDFVLGSRFLTFGTALRHAMPVWKYSFNRLSTLPARLVLGVRLTDFHSGFRVYRRRVFEHVAYQRNDNDYLFSFQIIAQAQFAGLKIGEVPVICRYFPGATQINFRKSMKYGMGASFTLVAYLWAKLGASDPRFVPRRPLTPSDSASSLDAPS
jgi:glycosyltransferase involved in cell wall biosynthesis